MAFTDPSFLISFFVLMLASMVLRQLRWVVAEKLITVAFSLALIYSYGTLGLAVFLCTVILNYVFASLLVGLEGKNRDWLLYAIIAGNLCSLGCFKYRNFVFHNFLGIAAYHSETSLLTPLAISFYTFHIISYQVDLHARRITHASFLNFIFYLVFFPHLIAGPIVRAWQLIPQFITQGLRRVNFSEGAYCLVFGLFLKLSCADQIGAVIDPLWDSTRAENLSIIGHWTVVLLYYAQIYADFAGYTMMAIGMANLLGYTLPQNFFGPMTAASLREFWRRWHVTLSTWLRDYLYIPLGGNRSGRARTYANLLITLTLGGLWHGAGWTFVIWGLMHGTGLAVEHVYRDLRPTFRIPRIFGLVLTQLWVTLSWVFFRSPSLDSARDFISGMFEAKGGDFPTELTLPLCLGVLVVAHNIETRSGYESLLRRPAITGVLCGILLALVFASPSHNTQFIYFKF
jgi:alginate O-acetyltransferase complex protein AlgI